MSAAFHSTKAQQPIALTPTLARSEGIEPTSHIVFARIYLTATGSPAPTEFDISLPTLTVQCTRRPNDKFVFELFVNFGNVTDTAFYPPWRRADDELFPPVTQKQPLMMEFLGYTHVKPVRRQFEYVVAPFGQLRYNAPSGGSPNLEEIAFYFQYLRALPTFRLSYPGHTVTFETAPLLAQIHKEPLCHASSL
ncbi:hypothetical protein [Granulicella sibirica]|uniref:hypothetical protein n=1 Tax=Granulicella sibirica TaxID=2479048 RepID=UPI001008BF88|nr:hypothetical protein [Granulicella sibirica]